MIKKNNGFTLIELLVVIVIIGILATIGVAQYNDHTERARTAKAQAEARDACTVSVSSCLETGETGCQTMSACMISAGLIISGDTGPSTEPAPFTTFTDSVPDANFRAAIVTKLGIAANAIDESDLNNASGSFNGYSKGITDLTGIGYLTSLTLINLSTNSITSVPDEIGNLTSLTRLYLNWNTLSDLPNGMSGLTSLTHIQVGYNNLLSLPSSLLSLTNLEELYLSNNSISTVPGAISGITSLVSLNMDRNNITTLPATMQDLSSLDIVYANWNSGLVLPTVSGISLSTLKIMGSGSLCSSAASSGWTATSCSN